MSRQFYRLFLITIWLAAALVSASAQESDSIGGYPGGPAAPTTPVSETEDFPAGPVTPVQSTDNTGIHPADPTPLIVRHVPDSVSERLKKQEEFRYANDPDFWKKDPGNNALGNAGASFLNSPLLKIVLYGLLTLLIAFVLYQVIVVNNLFIVRKGRRKKEAGDEEMTLTSDDLEAKISKAVAEGQYRLAIRYYYLLTLRLLDDRHLIRLDARSTNYDYLAQMKGKQSAPAFADLTRIYEYVWYGQYQPDTLQFQKIQSGFTQFIATA